MLKLSPTLVIKCSQNLNNIATNITFDVEILKNKYSTFYHKIKSEKPLDITNINKTAELIKGKADYFKELVESLELITGESVDKLIKANYSDKYYEEKIIDYYASLPFDFGLFTEMIVSDYKLNYYKLNLLGKFCDFYQSDVIKIVTKKQLALRLIKKFDYEKFGFTYECLMQNFEYIYEKHGYDGLFLVVVALTKHCPDNFFDYNFNPLDEPKPDWFYDYNDALITDYQINSENISIKGYWFDIAQVLPKNCTPLERLAFDFLKANVINTMHSLPDNYLKIYNDEIWRNHVKTYVNHYNDWFAF